MKEDTRKLLNKAEQALRTAHALLQLADMEFIAGRAYYAMFYIAEALLHEKDLVFRKHSGVHGAFGKNFIKTGEFDQKYHQWMIEAFNKRLLSDYTFDANMTKKNAEEMIVRADDFLRAAKHYLSK
ncbi:MAG: hypothetical protein A2Z83_00415 [Omnitrophica bacterium GWA2_52_8]|nr:MAG: hypothetical protein A2Z83_00415 [Omnitrophica bacterium GWA2_52_8]